nr:uncharacterized protein LOC117222539 isoform X1 [Megalopta genalis]
MGSAKSKSENGSRWRKSGNKRATVDRTGLQESEYEDVELLRLRKMIQNYPESFVLNNLMMCVQFFKNYEEEIENMKETLVSSRETKVNKGLPPQKRALLPDVLQEHVATNVRFTSTRQTVRPTTEPLQPVRIYTVYDNVEITEENLQSHYSNMNDSAMYNVLLQTTKHDGYIQLQLIEELGKAANKRREEDLSSIAENDDEFGSDSDSIYCMKPPADVAVLRRSKQGRQKDSRGVRERFARSMPNLPLDEQEEEEEEEEDRTEEENLYKNGGEASRSNHNLRSTTDSSGENGSSSFEKQRYPAQGSAKGHHRSDKQTPRAKGAVNQSHTSSLSSGYRSDNYAMTSDSSGNRSQKSSLKSSQRLEQSSTDEGIDESWIKKAVLPRSCFKQVTFMADGKLYDKETEKKRTANSKERRLREAMKRHNYDLFFASSAEFMLHFTKMFTHRLADCLGFDKESVDDIRREGCVIHCDKVMVSKQLKQSRVEQYEIMPAMWMQWPTCALEWLDRPRNTWPDPNDIETIKLSGCYVVPEGYVVSEKRNKQNLGDDLEWQLTFPTAERYLETCMTHAQVQVYLIALLLHKTFIRPVLDTMDGLTTAHIRHKFFWLMEEMANPSRWSFTRTGDGLVTFLDTVYHGMSQYEPILRDYFVRGRNLLQRIPCDHLLYSQKQLKRIIENPVMYVFHAMENIRFDKDFYPRLDFNKLLNILTGNELTVMNPALALQVMKSAPTQQRHKDDQKYVTNEFWQTARDREPKPVITKVVTNKTLINPRKAPDAIIEISIRCAELEGPRLCALLDFFIEHFIKMAERCNQYGAVDQKTLYLDHAGRLSSLLFEHQRYRNNARNHRDKINVLRKKAARSQSQADDPPETPMRNQEAAAFVAPLKSRFSRDPEARDAATSSSGTENDAGNTTAAVVHETRYGKSKLRAAIDPKNKTNRTLPTGETSDDTIHRVKFLDNAAASSNV